MRRDFFKILPIGKLLHLQSVRIIFKTNCHVSKMQHSENHHAKEISSHTCCSFNAQQFFAGLWQIKEKRRKRKKGEGASEPNECVYIQWEKSYLNSDHEMVSE